MTDSQSWTWVRDTSTGHLYDLPTIQLEKAGGTLPGVQVIASKPTHWGPWPRRPKHHLNLAGTPVKDPTEAAPDGPADDTKEH